MAAPTINVAAGQWLYASRISRPIALKIARNKSFSNPVSHRNNPSTALPKNPNCGPNTAAKALSGPLTIVNNPARTKDKQTHAANKLPKSISIPPHCNDFAEGGQDSTILVDGSLPVPTFMLW